MKKLCIYTKIMGAIFSVAIFLNTETAVAGMIDQSFDAVAAGSSGGLNIEATQEVAQTFTVGIGGELVGVALQISKYNFNLPTQDLLFEILPTIGGIPVEDNSLALANFTIPLANIPLFSPITDNFTFVDLSAFSITVTPGEVLAIALSTLGTGQYAWLSQNTFEGPTYSGGAEYSRRFTPSWGEVMPSQDAGFITYVPEPAILTLMSIGLVGIGFVKRRTNVSGISVFF